MYIPSRYKLTDEETIRKLIKEHAFGTIVVSDNGKPIASHIPLMLREIEGEDYITGHVALANPIWRIIEAQDDPVLVIFQGPHAYISASWYLAKEVPTWNYQAVHIYGKASIMSEEELQEDLILLLEKYEKHRDNARIWENLTEQNKKQMKGIKGFKIKIEDIQATSKLSQNRSDTDYQRIIDHLRLEDDPRSHEMADLMEKAKHQ